MRQPPQPRRRPERIYLSPTPGQLAAEAVYDGEGDRLVPGTRVRYDAVALMWAEHKNGMRPLRTVAERLGLTVAQVRECVRG